VRYGDKVCGWWIDGCYRDTTWCNYNYNDELLRIYYNAVKKGNPNAVVAFNNGVDHDFVKRNDSISDFTAGEQVDFTMIPEARFIDGAQWHMLAPLGLPPEGKNCYEAWCKPGVKYGGAYLREYIDKVNSHGGVVTVDIWIDQTGGTHFDPTQVETLRSMGF